jgi:hypothetical protein
VQAIYAHGNNYYCFVRDGSGWEARPIQRGPTNDRFIVIEEGLNVGEQIALAPRAIRDLVTLPKLSPEESQTIVRSVQPTEGQRVVREPGGGNALADERSGDAGGRSERGPADGMLAQYDSNGDGTLQLSELPDDLQDRIGAFDKDSNGELDGGETAAMRAARPVNEGDERGEGPLAGGGQ